MDLISEERTEEVHRRRAYLDQLRRILPASPAWEAWLAATGELPPDFSALPASWDLPNPLALGGSEAAIPPAQAWELKRRELKAQFTHWVLGSVPPAPHNLQAHLIDDVPGDCARSQTWQLTFGPAQRASLHIELLIPAGQGPFPVFATQSDHRGWALLALQRGYLGAVYAACDSADDSETYPALYPEADWACLPRRAWAASRLVDYLLTRPEVDSQRIVLTGHSRNGKQALIASAYDERIAAVIASSAGALGVLPTRFCSEQHFAEGIELITRVFPDWFHPRLRFFAGREDRLPVDLHELVALSAPRHCLISSALNDRCESVWGVEQTCLAVQRVYQYLGAEKSLALVWRPGGHETYTETIERYLDWTDSCFGRTRQDFPARFIYPVNWAALPARYAAGPTSPAAEPPDLLAGVATAADWRPVRQALCARLPALLGPEPPKAVNPGHDYGTEAPHLAELLDHCAGDEAVVKDQIMFGDYINADIYRPKDADPGRDKLPAVLWLPAFSIPNGYRAAYFTGPQFYSRLARQGYAVFCFDPIGMGRRVEEAERFYQRYPDWSLLGKMVRDAASAVEAMLRLPYVSPGQVWAVGYGLGAQVGLHLAAGEERLAGLAAACLPPFQGPAGLRPWFDHYNLVPRLAECAAELPYTESSLMACVAPRPLLVVSPQLDREAPVVEVTRWVVEARRVYTAVGANQHLEQVSPEDYNRLSVPVQHIILDWLSAVTARQAAL